MLTVMQKKERGGAMELNEVKAALEAVLFAHAEPLPTARLADILGVEEPLCEKLLVSLRDDCEAQHRGVQLIRMEDAWQLATKESCGELVKKALDTRRNTPLSPAALEVLAIIAYNQPVSRSFVEQVRGVDSSSTVSGLVEKGLIGEAGRLDLPGKPIAYKTTDAFLRTFGIRSLHELPPLHNDEAPADESAYYGRPESLENGGAAFEAEPPTLALRGGAFIEGEGGAAAFAGEEE